MMTRYDADSPSSEGEDFLFQLIHEVVMSEACENEPAEDETYAQLKEIQTHLIERWLNEMYINLTWKEDDSEEILRRIYEM